MKGSLAEAKVELDFIASGILARGKYDPEGGAVLLLEKDEGFTVYIVRLAGTTSSPAATGAVPPRSTRRIQFRRTLGEMPSFRESSAKVFSPDVTRPAVSRLNATEKTRRPSAFRGNSTMTTSLSEPILDSKIV